MNCLFLKSDYPDSKEYDFLAEEDSQHTVEVKYYFSKYTCFWKLALKILLGISFCYFLVLAGFMAGKHAEATKSSLDPPGNLRTIFNYNSTFSAPPSEDSDRAWAESFPGGGGFMIDHSKLSNVSAFSVFHQLHCIDMLRHRYYTAIDAASISLSDHKTRHEASPHAAHCFDYLRQSVQCSSDTNIEPYDWDLDGISGWGLERTCKDYDQVKKYAEERRAFP